jgi:Ca2+-binding RTX toxin-like protein
MTAGTVTFRDGATMLKANLAVDDQGQATFATARLADGTHHVTAAYQPAEGFAPSTSEPLIQVVDGAGPQANPTPSPAANAAGWHREAVTVTWNWDDEGAGIDPAHCPDRSITDREGRQTLTATCRDLAGNETAATYSVKLDTTSPTVSITSPTNGRYLQGDAVTADYTCQDGLSGVAACTGPVADGASLDTSVPGRHQFVVTARDRADNAHTLTVAYYVAVRPICAGRPATIVGTPGNDAITGTAGDDVIVTGAGRDWIRARGGNDIICAGGARDFVAAGDGDDNIDTGTGRDFASGGVGDDTISGRAGADILTGGLGADILTGGLDGDTLLGHDGDDHLHGGPDTDTCRGGAGTDQQATCEFTLGVP